MLGRQRVSELQPTKGGATWMVLEWLPICRFLGQAIGRGSASALPGGLPGNPTAKSVPRSYFSCEMIEGWLRSRSRKPYNRIVPRGELSCSITHLQTSRLTALTPPAPHHSTHRPCLWIPHLSHTLPHLRRRRLPADIPRLPHRVRPYHQKIPTRRNPAVPRSCRQ